MPTAASDARIAANRLNALKSTGPKTEEGKARSRRNSLKHGLTGEGVVLSVEDAAAVDRFYEELEEDLRPTSGLGRALARRVATLAIRLERSAREESARLAERVRHAGREFDDRRHAEIARLFDWFAAEPAANARKLRQSPEGIDRMLRAWEALKVDLTHPGRMSWSYSHWDRAENLTGRKAEDFPGSRIKALSKAIWGDFTFLESGEVDGLDDQARKDWARDRLAEVIDAELVGLREARAGLDGEAFALDRAEAGDRALLDPSPEANLARKYEAAAERGLYRALREFRQVEAEALELRAEGPPPEATPDETTPCEPLASSLPDDEDAVAGSPVAVAPAPPSPRKSAQGTTRRPGRGPNPPPIGGPDSV